MYQILFVRNCFRPGRRKGCRMGKDGLRAGYTTGTCAQAATKAAVWMLLTGEKKTAVDVQLPKGKWLTLPVAETKIKKKGNTIGQVSCAVRKDSGDDPDITNGILVYVSVSKKEGTEIEIDGGSGVGRVTKKGLDQPAGAAAINRVPRQMIRREAEEICDHCGYEGGLQIIVSVPEGERLAKKTFNPKLGITGGISILGTSGIVEPMSEQALLDTIRVEIKMQLANGNGWLLAAPGNYGLDFLERTYGISPDRAVKCSNFVGETVDLAAEYGAKGILFAAHLGKFVKVAGGIMNTHSRCADARMEIFGAAGLRAGLDPVMVRRILDCATTEEALELLNRKEREQVMGVLMERIEHYLSWRTKGELPAAAIVFSGSAGKIGETARAQEFLRNIAENEENQER